MGKSIKIRISKPVSDRLATLIEDLKKRRLIKGMQDFAEKIGEDYEYVCNIKNSLRPMPVQVIISICHNFNASANWLLLGYGDMYLGETETAETLLKRALDMISAGTVSGTLLRTKGPKTGTIEKVKRRKVS